MSWGAEARFEVAGGTVTGIDHLTVGKANQDAYAFVADGPNLVAVVCDGCGSGARSEVGAALGARLVAAQLLGELRRGGALDAPATWERARRAALAPLHALVSATAGSAAEVVSTFFLFTVVGVAIAGDTACVFSAGDGLIALGDEVLRLGPFPRNEPPYLGYALLNPASRGAPAREPAFVVHRVFPSSAIGAIGAPGALDAVLIATDGADDLLSSAERTLPGGGGVVGPLRRFWEEDRYFQNPDAVRRRLALINRSVARPVWGEARIEREAGLLRDDTTLVVVRRRVG